MTDNLTWIAARASGMVGYLLLTVAVAFGVALSLKVRSPSWPRFVTTEVHRRITLVALVFTGVHGITLWLDPFQGFNATEILVPFASHYRPLWVAVGIVAGYLTLALWLSERLQRRIGYAWWRRLHLLTFVAWILVTVHGLATGSDTRAAWAIALYAGGTALVLGLVVLRLWPIETGRRAAMVTLTAAGVWLLGAWSVTGPLKPGWNTIANNGNGSGQVTLTSAQTGDQPGAGSAPFNQAGGDESDGTDRGEPGERSGPGATAEPSGSSGAFPSTFSASFSGRIDQAQQTDGTWLSTIVANLAGGLAGQVELRFSQGIDGSILAADLHLALTNGDACSGSIGQAERGRLFAACATADGTTIPVRIQLFSQPDGSVAGQLSSGRRDD